MPNTRDSVFDRLIVDHYSLKGVSRVSWSLRPRFTDPQPLVFQLQASRGGVVDWEDVGVAQENSHYALDDMPRLYGQDMRLAYRVKLTTPLGVYTSPPATILGRLSRRQWLLVREMIRQLTMQSRDMRVFEGSLLKRRIQGVKCTVCTDPMTGGIRNSDCPTCKGVGFLDGYYQATDIVMYDMSPGSRETHNRGGRGTITDGGIKARFIGVPLLHNRDVWIDADSDQRYFIDSVQHISEMNQVPVAIEATLLPAEFSDIIYQVGMEGA